jgi:hypothetical protein
MISGRLYFESAYMLLKLGLFEIYGISLHLTLRKASSICSRIFWIDLWRLNIKQLTNFLLFLSIDIRLIFKPTEEAG